MIYKEIKNIIQKFNNDKIGYLYLFIQLVVFSSLVKYFQTDNFLIVNFFLSLFLSYFKNKGFYIKEIFIITLFTLIIFIIPIFFTGYNYLYLAYYIRILTGYFIVNYFKDKFIEYMHNLTFFLAFISLILYSVQIINLDFFNIFNNFSDIVLNEDRRVPGTEGFNHKYLIIFLVNGWAIYRNSGFMWEPAAYGAILSLVIIINLIMHRFKVNYILIMLILTLLTTFSVGAYFYLILITIAFLIQQKYKLKKIIFLSLIIILISSFASKMTLVYNQFEIMKEKIENEPENINDFEQITNINNLRVSRVTGFYAIWYKFLEFPFGYGFEEYNNKILYTPNGLMTILMRWGIIGFIVLLHLCYKIIYVLKNRFYEELKKTSFFIFILVIISSLAGNPFQNQPFIFSFLLFSLTLNNNKNKIET